MPTTVAGQPMGTLPLTRMGQGMTFSGVENESDNE